MHRDLHHIIIICQLHASEHAERRRLQPTPPPAPWSTVRGRTPPRPCDARFSCRPSPPAPGLSPPALTPTGPEGSWSGPPLVTVTPELDPRSDFAYLGGPPPDHFAGPFWVWKPDTGHATGTVLNSPLDAEARSAALDGQAQTAQFYSGVAFGVAASAFIAAVAEFVNKGDANGARPRSQLDERNAAGAGGRAAIPW